MSFQRRVSMCKSFQPYASLLHNHLESEALGCGQLCQHVDIAGAEGTAAVLMAMHAHKLLSLLHAVLRAC